MGKIIGIIGSRRRNNIEDHKLIWDAFSQIYENSDKICSGGCTKGGDRFAELIAQKVGLTEENGGLIIHRPKPIPKGSSRWEYTKVNYDRNKLIARDSDILIACVSSDRKGGTEHTIKEFDKYKKGEIILV